MSGRRRGTVGGENEKKEEKEKDGVLPECGSECKRASVVWAVESRPVVQVNEREREMVIVNEEQREVDYSITIATKAQPGQIFDQIRSYIEHIE